MRKSTTLFISLCAVYFLASGIALAGPAVVSIDEFGCELRNEAGSFVFSEYNLVSASNNNGNITLTCSHDFGERTNSGRSVIFNYDNTNEGTCGVGGPTRTKDWHQVISASGKAKLTCTYHE